MYNNGLYMQSKGFFKSKSTLPKDLETSEASLGLLIPPAMGAWIIGMPSLEKLNIATPLRIV